MLKCHDNRPRTVDGSGVVSETSRFYGLGDQEVANREERDSECYRRDERYV